MAGILAIALALLTFLRQRAKPPNDRKDLGPYGWQLAGVMVAALYTVAAASISWWAFVEAVPSGADFLLGGSPCLWFLLLFGPPVLFAVTLGGHAAYDFGNRVIRRRRENWPL